MDRNLQLRCSPNSWGKMVSSSPANHRTTCIKWPWPSKCWMGEQVSLLCNTSLPISSFWIVAHRTLLQDNPQLNISWDGKSETVSHYWRRIWTEQWKKNRWSRKSITMKGASRFVSSNWMSLSWFVTGEVELESGFRDGTPKWKVHAPTLFAVGTKFVLSMRITWKELVATLLIIY